MRFRSFLVTLSTHEEATVCVCVCVCQQLLSSSVIKPRLDLADKTGEVGRHRVGNRGGPWVLVVNSNRSVSAQRGILGSAVMDGENDVPLAHY